MPTIRQMLDPEVREQVYAIKDDIKRDRVLQHDFMTMNRTRFNLYLTAKAEALIAEKLRTGLHPDKVYRRVKLSLELIDNQWRREAKRLATAKNSATA